METNLLTETKSLLSGLVISSPKILTIKQLRTDYKETEGTDVPFRKLGFHTFEQFLQSIPETCRINGYGDHATVIPVISSKVKHINDMIMKQKTVKHKLKSGKKRSAGIFGNDSKNSQIQKFQPKSQYKPSFNWNTNSSQFNGPRDGLYNTNKSIDQNINSKYKNEMSNNSNPNKSSVYLQKNWESNSQNKIHPNFTMSTETANVNFKQKDYFDEISNISEENRNKPLDSSDCMQDYIDSDFTDDEETDFLLSLNIKKVQNETDMSRAIHNSNTSKVCKDIRIKLQILVSEHPNGVWCSDLLNFYKERWQESLNFNEFGFSSVIQMCCELSDILHSIRLTRMDWKIFDKRLPLPDLSVKLKLEDNFSNLSLTNNQEQEPPVPENMTFPEVESNFVYPDSVLQPRDCIERQWLINNEQINDYVEVCVAEVYDPSKFWIHLQSEYDALSTLMDNIQIFYNKYSKKYEIPVKAVQVGLYCVAIYLREYHRAKIVKLFEDDTVKIFFFDYGTITEVPIDKLYFLHDDFATLPQQAIRARLANILPIKPNTMWPRKAALRLLKLVSNKSLIACLMGINYDKAELNIILTDTTQPDIDIHINDILVSENFAVIGKEATLCKTSLATVPNVHLYPTFHELENAIYPCFSEVSTLLKLGQTYEIIYRGYFNNVNNCNVFDLTLEYLNSITSSHETNVSSNLTSNYKSTIKSRLGFGNVSPVMKQQNGVQLKLLETESSNNYNLLRPNYENSSIAHPKSLMDTLIILSQNNLSSITNINVGQKSNSDGQQLKFTQNADKSQIINKQVLNTSCHQSFQPTDNAKVLQLNENLNECSNLVIQTTIGSKPIHIIKLNNEHFIFTQEVIKIILGSDFSFNQWIKMNKSTWCPSKVINLWDYPTLYNEIKRYKIPGFYDFSKLGCYIRITSVNKIQEIIKRNRNSHTLNALSELNNLQKYY